MEQSGRVRSRGGRQFKRRRGPYSRGRPRPPLICRWSQQEGQGESSDESTRPTAIEIIHVNANPIPIADTNRVGISRWSQQEAQHESSDESTQPPVIERIHVNANPIPIADTNRDNILRWSQREDQHERSHDSTQPPSIERNAVNADPNPTTDTNRDNIWRWSQREGQGESYDESTQAPIYFRNNVNTNPIPIVDTNRDPIWRWIMREVNGQMHDTTTQPPSTERYSVNANPIPTADTNRANIWRWSQREGQGEGFDESTQPPIVEINTPIPNPIQQAISTRDNIEDEALVPITNVAQQKRGRGLAKSTEFDKLRRHGKVPLKINDGETAPCCENATLFTTRVTWILKHHADMSFARWTDVPKSVKDELIDRVRGDFELDWELKNHRLAVWKQLCKRFNAFHHELHKKYLAYASHEEALAGGTSLVEPLVWVKLCGRWGSDHFKKISNINKENRKKLKINHTVGRKSFVRILEEKRSEGANLVDFYKAVRWSKKNDKFVTDAIEDIYKEMTGKMDELAPENRTDEAAKAVFREVLGTRPGYARGLGEMVIPESIREKDVLQAKEYAMLVERHKKDAEDYKSQLDRVREEMRVVVERQIETDALLRSFMASFQSREADICQGRQ